MNELSLISLCLAANSGLLRREERMPSEAAAVVVGAGAVVGAGVGVAEGATSPVVTVIAPPR